MPDDPKPASTPEPTPAPEAPLTPEAASTEVGGRKGLEPTRYGDWEKGGIAVDF